MEENTSKTPYFKPLRKGIIFVCESANPIDDTLFFEHEKPYVFFHIDEELDAVEMNYCPPCPVCGSSDNIYQHAIAELKTITVLNEDEEDTSFNLCNNCGLALNPLGECCPHCNFPVRHNVVKYKEYWILRYGTEDGYRVDFGAKRSKLVETIREAKELVDFRETK